MIDLVELSASAAPLRYRHLLETACEVFWTGQDLDPAFRTLAGPECVFHPCGGLSAQEIAEQINRVHKYIGYSVLFLSPALYTGSALRELTNWLDQGGIAWRRYCPPRFPVFIDLDGQAVWIVGGGIIAARRVQALLPFGADITVVSPQLAPALQELVHCIHWRQERYRYIEGCPALVIAATNCRDTNRQVGEQARAAGIPVSVADCKEESTFWFPAIVQQEELVAGLISRDGDHRAVKQAAERMRAAMRGDREI